jgi:hypothetical protein
VSDCTANYRPILSSKRAPYFNNQAVVRIKRNKKKKIWSWSPKEGLTPRWSGLLAVVRDINDTNELVT